MTNQEKSSRTVYIPCPGSHDYSAAEKYGNFVYLSDRVHHKYATTMMFRDFYPKLTRSKADDYLLVVGPTIQVLVAASMIASLHKRINLLIYDHEDYVEKSIFFNFQEEDEDKEEDKT